MGGDTFTTASWGKTALEAFRKAVEQAEYDYGHAGYTGTIAEKPSFVMIDLPPFKDPTDLADELILDDDERVSDKWGPAGCIEIPKEIEDKIAEREGAGKKGENEKLFLFFGWASS